MVMYAGTREKKQGKDGKHPPRHNRPGLVKSGHEKDLPELTGFPVMPRMEEHKALLEQAASNEQRASILLRLQRTYGNFYVQRLIKSTSVQNKPEANTPRNITQPGIEATAKNKQKPPRPEKTYHKKTPKELEEKGGKPGFLTSTEYRQILEKTKLFYDSKINSPDDHQGHWTLVNEILTTIKAWWAKFRLFSRKARREALARLEAGLLKERSWLVSRVTKKSLALFGALEKYDVEHREGKILEYCFKLWQGAARKGEKGTGMSWEPDKGPPPAQFYEYVSNLENKDDAGLLKQVRAEIVLRTSKSAEADDWLAKHKTDKKYIPRIIYVPKEEMNSRKLQISGREVKYLSTGKVLSELEDYIYVMNPRGDFFAEAETRTTQLEFHHSSILAGEEVAAAGHLKTKNKITLDLESGHYQPNTQHMYNALKALKDKNADMQNVQVKPVYDSKMVFRGDVFFDGVKAIKAGKPDNDPQVKTLIERYIISRGGPAEIITPQVRKDYTRELKELLKDVKV